MGQAQTSLQIDAPLGRVADCQCLVGNDVVFPVKENDQKTGAIRGLSENWRDVLSDEVLV